MELLFSILSDLVVGLTGAAIIAGFSLLIRSLFRKLLHEWGQPVSSQTP